MIHATCVRLPQSRSSVKLKVQLGRHACAQHGLTLAVLVLFELLYRVIQTYFTHDLRKCGGASACAAHRNIVCKDETVSETVGNFAAT